MFKNLGTIMEQAKQMKARHAVATAEGVKRPMWCPIGGKCVWYFVVRKHGKIHIKHSL